MPKTEVALVAGNRSDQQKNMPSEEVLRYVRSSLADNTTRAYKSDIAHFLAWGGSIPADDTVVASYLVDHATKLSMATLTRRLASIAKAHAAQGQASPTRSELVRATLRGIKRTHGSPQAAATPLLKEDLLAVLGVVDQSTKGLRDRALLLIGFAGAFRRSELVDINCADIDYVRAGIVVSLRRSKTDQEGEGQKVAIPYGRGRWCPVNALREWIEHAGMAEGPVFRVITKHGVILGARLSGEGVSLVVKERVAAIGLRSDDYSGHSLRAGFATSASTAGISSWAIKRQTRHASDSMLSRYVRVGELFVDNAAGQLF